jgi:hypothetical protein
VGGLLLVLVFSIVFLNRLSQPEAHHGTFEPGEVYRATYFGIMGPHIFFSGSGSSLSLPNLFSR